MKQVISRPAHANLQLTDNVTVECIIQKTFLSNLKVKFLSKALKSLMLCGVRPNRLLLVIWFADLKE